MNNYWQNRITDQRERLLDKTIWQTDREIAKQYRKSLLKTQDLLLNTYDDIMTKENVLVSDLYKYNRYYDIISQLNANMKELSGKELPIMEQKLMELYTKNQEIIGNGLGINSIVNEEKARIALNSVWCSDGVHFSERIWTNTASLGKRLEHSLFDAVSRGASRTELKKELMQDYGVSFYCSNRLVRTELSYINNKSAIDKYEEAGIERYTILAEADACDECLELADQEFDLGTQILPVHPNCRCCTIAVI